MKPFQIIVLVAFGALALLAVFVFATFSGSSSQNIGTVVVWGTLPESTIEDVLNEVNRIDNGFEQVRYREISENAFVPTLVEAIAAGNGPDLVLLSAAAVGNQRDKLIPISYNTVSRREFQDSFVEAGEVFLSNDGVLGLPFYIDPFVMYWNRTLFSQAGIPRAVKYWDEFVDVAPLLSRATESGTLTQSAVALGEWENVEHAKDIVVSLMVGLGNPVVSLDENETYVATLSTDSQTTASESALRFYTEFADPVKSVYSWNRSQANSRDAFLAGKLAVYLGSAGEVFSLRASNPNLNFDVTSYPQVRGGVFAVPSHLYALAIPRGSANTRGALQVALALSGAPVQEALVTLSGLPSVRRDVVSVSPENPFESVFQDAALNAFSFRDPDPAKTSGIFERMIEGVSSGRFKVSEAVRSGQSELDALIK